MCFMLHMYCWSGKHALDLLLLHVGYTRIVLALVSFYYMPTDHVIATWAYIISSLLDAVDGHAARMLNQGQQTC